MRSQGLVARNVDCSLRVKRGYDAGAELTGERSRKKYSRTRTSQQLAVSALRISQPNRVIAGGEATTE